MNMNEVMAKYGNISKTRIRDDIEGLGGMLFGSNWGFTKARKWSETTIMDQHARYYVDITKHWLEHGCGNTQYNRAGCVLTMQHIRHEERHVWQNITEWHRKVTEGALTSTDRMTDVIRRIMVTNFYPSGYNFNYNNDPSEWDADVHGMERTVEYFEKNPIISVDEAGAILVDVMMSDNYGHKKELQGYSIKTFDDLIKAAKDIRNESAHKIYPVTDKMPPIKRTLSNDDMTKEFLTDSKYMTHFLNKKIR